MKIPTTIKHHETSSSNGKNLRHRRRRHLLTVRKPGFQSGNTGSIPVDATTFSAALAQWTEHDATDVGCREFESLMRYFVAVAYWIRQCASNASQVGSIPTSDIFAERLCKQQTKTCLRSPIGRDNELKIRTV